MKIFPTTAVALALAGATSLATAADWQALPDKAPEPADNPTTPAKVELGKLLFMDPRLSATGTVSCNSCHNVMLGGDDNRNFSMGVHGQMGGRSAPTVWNSAFSSVQFWDGREPSLEEQAKGPIANPVEMGMKGVDVAVSRVRRIPGYAPYFEAAFGSDTVTVSNVAKAIAAYERTLITPNSPYDRYVKGDKKAMTEQQVRGMNTFAEVGCTACHSGPAFNGPTLPEGTGFFMKFPTFADNDYVKKYDLLQDLGRHDVTKADADKHLFKVPTLRNIALTAPYFHNGSVLTLDEAVKVMAKTQLGKDLNEPQTTDIVAFLGALTGEFPVQTLPQLPPTEGWAFEYAADH
ncbi:MAG: cytochrome-c peroxidase [Thiohalobacteraceae bacterium]|nr:cytochrome-c peroxidase [Gammaproteobacteria bacterium]